jgi:UDPglucose--hexose-1-phosphate uridylyltransferase
VLRAPADATAAWQARIIPNRYPFVAAADTAIGPGTARPAHGVHEVVIESPRHDTLVTAVDPAAWRAAWSLVQRRLAELAGRDDLAWGTVFKNSGPRAGASLEHVHSQLVAVDFVPPAVAAEFAAAATEAEPFAALLAEAAAERRIVAEAGGLVALVPAAPRQPGEIWIVPAEREPHFHAAPPARAQAVADLTRDLVGRLARMLPGADFNWWLHEAAWRGGAAAVADRWHWHLEILPRVNQLAGFELGTGCHITPLPAAEAAARLRDA